MSDRAQKPHSPSRDLSSYLECFEFLEFVPPPYSCVKSRDARDRVWVILGSLLSDLSHH